MAMKTFLLPSVSSQWGKKREKTKPWNMSVDVSGSGQIEHCRMDKLTLCKVQRDESLACVLSIAVYRECDARCTSQTAAE